MKKNLLFLLFLALVCYHSAFAFSWVGLWETPNQQGKVAYEKGDMLKATQLFQDPMWQGVAAYRSKNYKLAFQSFAKLDSPLANYNKGNAFAQLGNYQEAIKAYDRALSKNPNMADAKYNRDLLKKLLKQQSSPQSNPKNSAQHTSSNQPKNSQPSSSHSNQEKNNSNPAQEKDSNKQPHFVPPKSSPAQAQQQESQQQQALANERNLQNQQQVKQWLQQIPDDPGGLLKNKFLRDHLRQNFSSEEGSNS